MNSTNNPLLFASIVNENAIRAKENAKPKTAGYIKNIFCIIQKVYKKTTLAGCMIQNMEG